MEGCRQQPAQRAIALVIACQHCVRRGVRLYVCCVYYYDQPQPLPLCDGLPAGLGQGRLGGYTWRPRIAIGEGGAPRQVKLLKLMQKSDQYGAAIFVYLEGGHFSPMLSPAQLSLFSKPPAEGEQAERLARRVYSFLKYLFSTPTLTQPPTTHFSPTPQPFPPPSPN